MCFVSLRTDILSKENRENRRIKNDIPGMGAE